MREPDVQLRYRRPLDPLRHLDLLTRLVVIVWYIWLHVKDRRPLYDVNPTKVKRSALHTVELAEGEADGVGPVRGAGGEQSFPGPIEARRVNQRFDRFVSVVMKQEEHPDMGEFAEPDQSVLGVRPKQNRDRPLGSLCHVPLSGSSVLFQETRRHVSYRTQANHRLPLPDYSSSLHVCWDGNRFRCCPENLGNSQVLRSRFLAGKPVTTGRQVFFSAACILLS
mmetsp:Transcript_23707/g.53222  ORF Transcript_23707/g.53222 Transcript_23707/m.53222 type:complete len:223 (-) Transcript_23707:365-1033(-)